LHTSTVLNKNNTTEKVKKFNNKKLKIKKESNIISHQTAPGNKSSSLRTGFGKKKTNFPEKVRKKLHGHTKKRKKHNMR